MKAIRTIAVLIICALGAYPVVAHHPAADMVDEEIYATIDEMVSDTPHGDLVFDEDMGSATTEIDITGRMSDLNSIVDDGLLTYVSMLDGDVTLTIDFAGDGNVTLSIVQMEDPALADKTAPVVEATTFGDLKAAFR